MNWGNVELVIIGLSAFVGAFVVALWISLVIWTFRDMRARSRDAFAQLLAALMMFVLGPVGIILYLLLRRRDLQQRSDVPLQPRHRLQVAVPVEQRRAVAHLDYADGLLDGALKLLVWVEPDPQCEHDYVTPGDEQL